MRYLPALILDAVLVLVFAVIGRASHSEDPAGFLLTAWPFLIALVVGHGVAALLSRRPRRPWSPVWGAVVWIVTVAGGMLLRVLSGDTAQLPFIIVATIVLGVFLLGWRALAAVLRRRRAGAGAGSAADAGAAPVVAADAGDRPERRTEHDSGADADGSGSESGGGAD
ncbi:DUF3054 family protein [Microbacterium hydrocarbonoxydans]|uniref:DUF3054 family protein n=1 Tax=Microbacterium hydrocarbonoxydans TaxID=273678 RepID=UPI0013DA943C